jgi:enhancing lycopene biosynthesis protein 2
MKKVAVILSGCGVYDGSEIHEAVLSLWALSKNEVNYQCYAPDKEQYHVINHITKEVSLETRNVLIESARIARGNIKPLTELKVDDYSAVLLPGGFGVAKNLSNFAIEGENYKVDIEVERIIKEFHSAHKPIAALCIAPVILAKIVGGIITIGNDYATAKMLNNVGATHTIKEYNEVAVDEKNMFVTNPCYMLADSIFKVSLGVEAAVEAMIGLMNRKH